MYTPRPFLVFACVYFASLSVAIAQPLSYHSGMVAVRSAIATEAKLINDQSGLLWEMYDSLLGFELLKNNLAGAKTSIKLVPNKHDSSLRDTVYTLSKGKSKFNYCKADGRLLLTDFTICDSFLSLPEGVGIGSPLRNLFIYTGTSISLDNNWRSIEVTDPQFYSNLKFIFDGGRVSKITYHANLD